MSSDTPAAPEQAIEHATPAQVARDLARKCVALAIGSGDSQTYRTLMDLSAVYDRCAALLDAEDALALGRRTPDA